MRGREDKSALKPAPNAARPSAGLASLFFDPALARNEAAQLKGKVFEYAVVALVVIFISTYEWLRKLIGLPQQLMEITVFALAVAGYCALRIWLLWQRVRALQSAQRGWRMMEGDFESLGEHGFYLFDAVHDAAGSNLGPVIAGPTGIFSLSIRSNPRTGALFEKVEHVDARTVLIGGRPGLADPLRQARKAAAGVQSFLESQGLKDFPVTPILLYPGWKLARPPALEERDVIVTNEKTLASEVEDCPRILEPKHLIPICEALSGGRPG
ncbi:MAG: hypothetical protein ACR2OZ_06815 [Verrucomicrobiales bacterium]